MSTINNANSSGEFEKGLRISKAAVMLGVSERTVYRLIAEGKLPKPTKIGRCSVLLVSAVQRLLKGGQ